MFYLYMFKSLIKKIKCNMLCCCKSKCSLNEESPDPPKYHETIV